MKGTDDAGARCSCLPLVERSNALCTSGDALGRRLETRDAENNVLVDISNDKVCVALSRCRAKFAPTHCNCIFIFDIDRKPFVASHGSLHHLCMSMLRLLHFTSSTRMFSFLDLHIDAYGVVANVTLKRAPRMSWDKAWMDPERSWLL